VRVRLFLPISLRVSALDPVLPGADEGDVFCREVLAETGRWLGLHVRALLPHMDAVRRFHRPYCRCCCRHCCC
jgi:hypothetical protein